MQIKKGPRFFIPVTLFMLFLSGIDVFRKFPLRWLPDIQSYPGFKLFDLFVHGNPPSEQNDLIRSLTYNCQIKWDKIIIT